MRCSPRSFAVPVKFCVVVLVFGSAATSSFAQQCQWASEFHLPGMDGDVYTLAGHDDGSGPAVYAGGAFVYAGAVAANRIAKWDGTTWSALGTGMTHETDRVGALAVYDDSTGSALYAGGTFPTAGGVRVSNIAKWDSATWSALGSGTNGPINALQVYDDGTGPALHAGGQFLSVGDVEAMNIAR